MIINDNNNCTPINRISRMLNARYYNDFKQLIPQNRQNTKQLAISRMLFHLTFIFGKAHWMIQVSMTLTFGQNYKSRLNFPKKKRDKKLNYWPCLGCCFAHRLHHIYYHSFLWLIWVFFLAKFFIIFRNISGHSDLDLWPKVTNFNRIRVSAVSNCLVKIEWKSL